MKRSVTLGLGLLLLLVACGRGSKDLPDVTVEVTLAPDPPQLGPVTVTLEFYDAGGQPIPGATVQIEGNMSHAGMVPVFADASEVAPGRYRAVLEFTMGGDWFILVRADLPDGRSLERQVDVPGVGAMFSDTPAP